MNVFLPIAIVFLAVLPLSVGASAKQLTLQQSIDLALSQDPWLQGSVHKQQALTLNSEAAASLPDPTISVAFANWPTDGFSQRQEGMTQIKLGISQMLPRGDSLAISQTKLRKQADKQHWLRLDRQARLKDAVTQAWLDAYLAQQTLTLIQQDWALFEQMVEVASARYASALGGTRQQDVISAQLELVQLEDRLLAEQQKQELALAKLWQWLSPENPAVSGLYQWQLPTNLPVIILPLWAKAQLQQQDSSQLIAILSNHPSVTALETDFEAAELAVELVKQQYKPQWGVNASYGYRVDMPSGDSRADLLSIGVNFDLPLFTDNRQDKWLSAAVSESQVVKTEQQLLLRQLASGVEQTLSQLRRLKARQSLYQQSLLTQLHEHAEVTLTAYTNDDGDFTDVVRTRIAELNGRISALKIDVEVLKTLAKLQYFAPELTASKQD